MTKKKIASVVQMYRERFEKEGIEKVRMDIDSRAPLSKRQKLQHAHYLLDGVVEYSADRSKKAKTGRHLGSVQTLLRTSGWYSLRELMDHNRP